MVAQSLWRPSLVFSAAILLRVVFLFYGMWQDSNSAFKYTDIDYYVFTDASRYMAHGRSPYERETYRYTPLLAWLLLPTTWSSIWFSFGKVLFAAADIIAGWLILVVLRTEMKMSTARALRYASIWLLNPMVATISTRGSSEGLLGVMVIALLWAVIQRQFTVAGILLGLGVHFKIYPFIYAPTIIWWLDDERLGQSPLKELRDESIILTKAKRFFNHARLRMIFTSLSIFAGLNIYMYIVYGWPFLHHTYLHHVTRVDHRHNFSPYNILLYLSSSGSNAASIRFESVAFAPQLLLSAIIMPFLLAKKDLPSTMLASTWAFTCFNKVCTSQYFLWYMVFLPFYLPKSSLMSKPRLGLSVLCLWVATQALWLQQGYELEFLGRSTFVPGLWGASIAFFLSNIWILGIIVSDVGKGFAPYHENKVHA